jgi:hypothetical protein
MYVKRDNEVRSCKHCCSGKAMCYIMWVCIFVALGIEGELRMTITSSVACPVLQYFYTLTHKLHDIRKNLLNTKCVF